MAILSGLRGPVPLRPGPQPQNRIAATFAEQYARALRPRRTPDEQIVTFADLRRFRRYLRKNGGGA
jgi:hypothetical protein